MDLEILSNFLLIFWIDACIFLKRKNILDIFTIDFFSLYYYSFYFSIFFTVIRSFDWTAISEASSAAILGFGGLTPPVIK